MDIAAQVESDTVTQLYRIVFTARETPLYKVLFSMCDLIFFQNNSLIYRSNYLKELM